MNNRIFVFFALFTSAIGVNAISFFSNYIELTWEWPAERQIKHKVIVEVIELSKIWKLLKSPSFAENLPDPMSLKGKILKGNTFKKGALIKLKLPKVELNEITEGSIVMLGMVSENTVVCIKDKPTGLSDAEENVWLENIECN